ncbi:MAG TPA: JAB domain-containing protein, partial [Dehalococcoidales bacterium]|nr:JAB domain-containing protein [Dehalococcoidales bacterium]
STSDRELTRQLVYVGKIMQMKVVDHIIIGNNRYYSFADEGLIEEYEMDFLNLKLRGTSEAKRRIYRARLSSDKYT